MTQATLSAANVSNTAVIQTKSFTPKDIDRIFKAQKKKSLELRLTNYKTRIQKLKKLKDVVLKYQTEIQKALHADFRKSAGEVDITEILPTIAEINDAIRHVKHWMRPKNVLTPPTLLGATSRIVYEPKGVCLVIAPWNYPFHLAIAPLAAAIAAGNTVMLKPSEFTPNTANVINLMLGEIFSEDEVAVFEGDVTVATALLDVPFDHIFFTGSTPVGKIVMAAAAKNLTTVTLELGGKSPSIIAEDADLKVAAERIMWGKFLNAGQTCVAPDYLLIPESKVEEFVKHAKDTTESFFKSKPENFTASTDFCRIVNAKNFSRVSSYIDDAVKKGAKIAYGGELRSSDNFIAPTILTNVSLDAKIMEDEIFGPLLPIVTYKSLDEAIHIINEKPKPLALYIFTKKRSTSKYVLRRTSSGGAVINDVILHLVNPNLPFGGVNHSGHGSYHGVFGFKTFSHERSVLQTPKASIAKLMYPPYSSFVRLIVRLTTKFFV
ncbi:putative aldehyde dehydrogenase [Leptospira yanagawae serovar Saopaulo str. Sao Paulo = ATCC 700523]|uniref:Aldehyde dehydrogenase n=1 Tax=Leptospira yanagawae serovar Saopaulo str. Sao Paulo = ATCC 700523 TaxID=1249483 RepID=A0A5E8HKG5_9LEPT|nr:aldehyde dehydrogenase family protein [Leptospira yanagawae]EOQ90296.1 putative aldehyde dehydrogenase [Leptospira yanagawae serovar Saopaulo str. Sao Paulo = ATCC 700523]